MQSSHPLLRIGTRGSPLALAQARLVRQRLSQAHGMAEADIAIEVISTSGDRITDRPLSEVGGKGLFTKEIEQALIEERIDLAVHSAKDVATRLPEGLTLAAFLEREDVRDAFVSLVAPSLEALPEGARFGTSSLRRAAQIRRARPDLAIVPFRGNVDTRLAKLRDGVADATLLAVAGLNRLERPGVVTALLDPRAFPPAPAQGAIGLEIRTDDSRAATLVAPLDHAPTRAAVSAERAMLAVLDGSCRTPIAAFTEFEGGGMRILGQILLPDGSRCIESERSGPVERAAETGAALGEDLLAAAGPEFMARLKG